MLIAQYTNHDVGQERSIDIESHCLTTDSTSYKTNYSPLKTKYGKEKESS